MFLVGTRKEHSVNGTANCNLNNCTIANLNECVCPLAGPYYTSELPPYTFYRQGSNHYERIFPIYNQFDKQNAHRHSYRQKMMNNTSPQCLTKSLSYAANIDRSVYQPQFRHNHSYQDFCRFNSMPRTGTNRGALRPSKSVPEGLARWEYCGSHHRRPIIRNVHVIEQITTSV